MATAWQNEMAQAQQDNPEVDTYWFPIVHNETRGLVYDAKYDDPHDALQFAEAVKKPGDWANTTRYATAPDLCENHNAGYAHLGITWTVIPADEITTDPLEYIANN